MNPIKMGNFEDWGPKKQLNYEQKMTRQLLNAVYAENSFQVTNVVRNAGDAFGFGWFNDTYPKCPVGLGSRRLEKPLMTSQMGPKLITAYKKTEHYRAFSELKSDLSDRPYHALVFDYHGDDMTDLVITNAGFLADPAVFGWVLSFRANTTEETLHLVTWKEFVDRLSKRYQLAQ